MTRTQIIHLCQAEAHSNLQRHIQSGAQIGRRYATYTTAPRGGGSARPLSAFHLMALAAIAALLRRP